MKIALLGYGRMGLEIERRASAFGAEVVKHFSSEQPLRDADELCGVDAAIDFSNAAAVVGHVTVCAAARVPVVIGTTGWSERLPEVERIVHNAEGACVHGANFSIGVQLFIRLARAAGEIFQPFPQYDAAINEVHHRHKLDSPSGTALALAQTVLQGMPRKETTVMFAEGRQYSPSELILSSQRVGAVPGTHTLLLDSDVDSIELTHTARSRAGFADGALQAAQWIRGRRGVFTVQEFIQSKLSEGDA